MSIRTTLLNAVTTSLASTSVKTSSELPWITGETPLYEKNMRTVYFDQEDTEVVQLHRTLDGNDVYQVTTTVFAYLTVDAKNQPADMAAILSAMNAARSIVPDQFDTELITSSENQDDRKTYTFEYGFTAVQ
jgi:hypothetical protein